MKEKEEIEAKIEVGMQFKCVRDYKCHVINVFDDEGDEVVVWRYWLKHKKRWNLESQYTELFLIQFDYGSEWIK
jgi:hypothetical protein